MGKSYCSVNQSRSGAVAGTGDALSWEVLFSAYFFSITAERLKLMHRGGVHEPGWVPRAKLETLSHEPPNPLEAHSARDHILDFIVVGVHRTLTVVQCMHRLQGLHFFEGAPPGRVLLSHLALERNNSSKAT